MGKAAYTQESFVTFKDFELVVRNMPNSSKFSTLQLKSVFMSYAGGMSAADAKMKSVDFKDKFFPGIHWQRGQNIPTLTNNTDLSQKSYESDGRTESVHVDNILAGLKGDQKDRLLSNKLKEKEQKYQVGKKPGTLQPIKEDRSEVAS